MFHLNPVLNHSRIAMDHHCTDFVRNKARHEYLPGKWPSLCHLESNDFLFSVGEERLGRRSLTKSEFARSAASCEIAKVCACFSKAVGVPLDRALHRPGITTRAILQ